MAARTNKGHPKKAARRARALERLESHINGPDCGPNCPKKPKVKVVIEKEPGRVTLVVQKGDENQSEW